MRLLTRLLLAMLSLAAPALAQPDLSIFARLEAGDEQAEAGDRISLEYQACNGGTQDVEDPVVAFYLSTDAVFDSGDTFLESEDLGDLDGGECDDEGEQVSLPSNVADGNYFVLSVIDPFDVVAETDETNNVSASSIQIGQPNPNGSPDLVAEGLSILQDQIEAGDTFTARYYVANDGDQSVPRATGALYLSRDAVWSSDDLFLEERTTGGIRPGERAYVDARIVDVPTNVEAGDYVLLAVADAQRTVAESDETNNVTALAVTVVGGTTGAVIGEAGVLSLARFRAGRQYVVELQGNWQDPVVVTPTFSSGTPTAAVPRVERVSGGEFRAVVDEWDYLGDRELADVEVPYLVIEAGVHTLADGRRIEAGYVETSRSGTALITFSERFVGRPVVFATTTSSASGVTLGTRLRVRPDRARVDLVPQEGTSPAYQTERVAWIAIQDDAGDEQTGVYDARLGPRRYTDAPRRIRFRTAAPSDAVFLAAVQSLAEADPVVVQYSDFRGPSVVVQLQEDQAFDTETTHAKERVGFAVFARGLVQGASMAARLAPLAAASVEANPAFGVAHYPNPLRDRATVTVSLDEASYVRLDVFDVTGRRVAALADGAFEAGRHTVPFDAGSLPSGVYLYRLTTDAGQATTGRMTIIR